MKRPLVAVALAAGLAALTSACGTGLEAQTYKETGREDGARVDLEAVSVRFLHVAAPPSGSTYPQGSTAVVLGGLGNNGTAADSLVGVTSELADSTRLLLDGKPVPAVPLPALGSAGTTWRIELVGLKRALHAAQFVPITLSFAKAGRVSLNIPVHAGDNGLETREVSQDPYSHGEDDAGHGEDRTEQGGTTGAGPEESPEGGHGEETGGH